MFGWHVHEKAVLLVLVPLTCVIFVTLFNLVFSVAGFWPRRTMRIARPSLSQVSRASSRSSPWSLRQQVRSRDVSSSWVLLNKVKETLLKVIYSLIWGGMVLYPLHKQLYEWALNQRYFSLFKLPTGFLHHCPGYCWRASRMHTYTVLHFSRLSSPYSPSWLAGTQILNFCPWWRQVFTVRWDWYGHSSGSVRYTLHSSTSRYNGLCRASRTSIMSATFLRYERLGDCLRLHAWKNKDLTVLVF